MPLKRYTIRLQDTKIGALLFPCKISLMPKKNCTCSRRAVWNTKGSKLNREDCPALDHNTCMHLPHTSTTHIGKKEPASYLQFTHPRLHQLRLPHCGNLMK